MRPVHQAALEAGVQTWFVAVGEAAVHPAAAEEAHRHQRACADPDDLAVWLGPGAAEVAGARHRRLRLAAVDPLALAVPTHFRR